MDVEAVRERRLESCVLESIDDRFTYYDDQRFEDEESRIQEEGLWHAFGFGNRQKNKPRYE